MCSSRLWVAGAGAVVISAASAHAKLSVQVAAYSLPLLGLVPPTYVAAATQDPKLAGKWTMDVLVVVPPGDEYTTTDLLVTCVGTTTMYNRSANPSNNRTPTDSDDWSLSPRNEYDTFIS